VTQGEPGRRAERFLVVAFSGLALLAPALGLAILSDCLFPTGGPPSTLSGDAKRTFLLEVFDTALRWTVGACLLLLAPALLSRWRLQVGPAARRARRVAEVSILTSCASLGAWVLLARAALLRQ